MTEYLFARLGEGNTIRTTLTTPTTFYVRRNGSDVTGDGTNAKPWATRSHAYQVLQSNYDFGGQQVIVQVGDTDVLGAYTDGFNAFGPIIGQAGPTGILFRGNVADPSKCKISPTNGNGFGNAFGAQCAIQGFYFDFSNGSGACDGTGPGDMVTVNQGGEIWITSPVPGVRTHSVTFGPSGGICYNDLSAAFGGKIFIDTYAKMKIDAGAAQISGRTATWTSGAGTMVVNDATGLKPGMHITAANGLYANQYIVDLAGTTITLAGAGTFASRTNEPVTFNMARQCHMDVGVGGSIIHNTNGGANLNEIEFVGSYKPFYYGGFVLSNGSGAQASIQTVLFSGTNTSGGKGANATVGPKFVVKTLGSIDTLAIQNDIATYLPGDSHTATATWAAGNTTLAISANPTLPYSGTEIFAGNLVLEGSSPPKIQNPSRVTFGSATSEMTTVEYLLGTFGTGGNTDLKLSRPVVASGSGTLTFVGVAGQGGQYN